ncbi:MAG: hypothetical protein RSC92_02595, partial [Clostridia bacterium]
NNFNTISFYLVILYDIYCLSKIYFKFDDTFFNHIYVILSVNIVYIVIGIVSVISCKIITNIHKKVKSKILYER